MRSLIKAVFRISLIFIFINMFVYLINFISMVIRDNNIYYSEQEQIDTLPYIIGASIVFIILSCVLCLLWWKTDKVVKFVAGDISENEIVINTSNNELFRVVMRMFGIYLIVSNVPYITAILGRLILFNNTINEYQVDPESFIIKGITILLGIWLIVGNKGIMKVYTGIKNYIQPPLDDDKNE